MTLVTVVRTLPLRPFGPRSSSRRSQSVSETIIEDTIERRERCILQGDNDVLS